MSFLNYFYDFRKKRKKSKFLEKFKKSHFFVKKMIFLSKTLDFFVKKKKFFHEKYRFYWKSPTKINKYELKRTLNS